MKKLVPCPIDNTNLCEDALEDCTDLFGEWYAAKGHRKGNVRHMIGHMAVKDESDGLDLEDGIFSAKWSYGSSVVEIRLLATAAPEDYEYVRDEVFEQFKRTFKSWEEYNEGLKVRFDSSSKDVLEVSFYYEIDE